MATERSLRSRLPVFGDRVALGASLSVSPFCVGSTSKPEVIEAAFEAGINFFFISCDLHWPAYEPSREGLRRLFRRPGVRDQVVVCAASYLVQPQLQTPPFLDLLEAVAGLERLDVLCAGGMYGQDLERRLTGMRAHRASSFLGNRGLAVSFHERATARLAVEQNVIDAGFVRFNPVHPGAKNDLFPFVSHSTVPLFGFKTAVGTQSEAKLRELGLGSENWVPTVVDHYRYALSTPGLAGLLFSPTAEAHLRSLSDGLAQGPLSADEQAYLETLSQHLFSTDSGAVR